MTLLKYSGKNLLLTLMGMISGIFLVAVAIWSGIFWLSDESPGLSGVLVFSGALILLIALFLVRQVLHFMVIKPVLQACDTAYRVAEGKPMKGIQKTGADEISQLVRRIAHISDVLAYKRQELAQEHSEYQNLFETVPCLITVQDRNLRLIRYNREFAQKFDPRKGDYCYSVYKGRSEKCENCPVEKTFQDGQSHTFEEAGYSRDGKPMRWVARTAPILDENGNVVAAMEMSLDVTLKRQLQEKLEASQRRYQAIFSNIPNPVFVLDPATMEILDCNDSVEAVYGYGQTELGGKSFLDLFGENDRNEYAAKVRDNVFMHQVKQFDKHGNPLFVDIRSSVTMYPEWEVLLVTTSDITQQLETEQQLIQASKMTTLGEMATGIAHELNQPLSVMKTASSFMLKKFESGTPLKHEIMENMLKKIDSNVDRASNIINHMRQFARKSEMDLEKVDVNHVLQLAAEIFYEQLKVRGIQVVWENAANLPLIRANPSRLEQVFINILINARDAIEEKWGDARVDPPEKAIIIKTDVQQDYVVVEICDTGNGIPMVVMDKLFEPFYTTKTVGEGTGLGLSISYGIIKECGGTIQASNRESGGACFYMKFPVYENDHHENDHNIDGLVKSHARATS